MSKVKAEHDSDYDDTPEGAPGTTKRDADSDGSDDEEAPAKKKQKQKQEEKGTESPARAAAAAGPFTGSPPKPTKNAEGEIYFQVRAVYCSKVDAVFLMTGDFVCGFGPGTTFTTRQISQLGQKKRLTVRRYQKNLLFDIREVGMGRFGRGAWLEP